MYFELSDNNSHAHSPSLTCVRLAQARFLSVYESLNGGYNHHVNVYSKEFFFFFLTVLKKWWLWPLCLFNFMIIDFDIFACLYFDPCYRWWWWRMCTGLPPIKTCFYSFGQTFSFRQRCIDLYIHYIDRHIVKYRATDRDRQWVQIDAKKTVACFRLDFSKIAHVSWFPDLITHNLLILTKRTLTSEIPLLPWLLDPRMSYTKADFIPGSFNPALH